LPTQTAIRFALLEYRFPRSPASAPPMTRELRVASLEALGVREVAVVRQLSSGRLEPRFDRHHAPRRYRRALQALPPCCSRLIRKFAFGERLLVICEPAARGRAHPPECMFPIFGGAPACAGSSSSTRRNCASPPRPICPVFFSSEWRDVVGIGEVGASTTAPPIMRQTQNELSIDFSCVYSAFRCYMFLGVVPA